MSHFLFCSLLLLGFLTGGAVVLVKASDNVINCGYDISCQATVKLMAAVTEIKNQLDELRDKQTMDLEELKVSLNRSLASTTVISKQLENHSADLLRHEERLNSHNACPELNEKLDELAANVNDIQRKQIKDAEELKANLNSSLASTAVIATQLEKHTTDLLSGEERLKAQNGCPDVNEKLDKLVANTSDIHSKQLKYVEELNVKMDRSFASTTAISTQLEKHSGDLLSHDEHLKAHDILQSTLYKLMQNVHKPQDCSDVRASGNSVSGVYRVYPSSNGRTMKMDVYCDFRGEKDSWLVFQRRKDGSVNFVRTWNEYANGFGDLNGEFWLGNEKLSFLTMNKRYKLLIELEDSTGQKKYAAYWTFSIRPSTEKYRLIVGGYYGNAGDSLDYHNQMRFSTKDQDNDAWNGGRCDELRPGGWWFKSCHHSNLNGLYLGNFNTGGHAGIHWYTFKGNLYSLKATQMLIIAI